jgi:predicted permease
MVPCLIFGNIIQSVDVEKVKVVAIVFLFAVITHLIGITLGHILQLIMRIKSEEKNTWSWLLAPHLVTTVRESVGKKQINIVLIFLLAGNIAIPLFGSIL